MRIARIAAVAALAIGFSAAHAAPGSLGVGLVDTPPGAPAHAAMVGMVVPGGAADKVGLHRGDIIESVNNYTVSGATELQGIVMSHQAGDVLAFSVLRQGPQGLVRLQISATLSPRTGMQAMAAPSAAAPYNWRAAPAPQQSTGAPFASPQFAAPQSAPQPQFAQAAGAMAGAEPLPADFERIAQSVPWTRFDDPYEHAFTIDTPAGWKTEGGLIRLSPVTINPVLHMTAPDHSVMLIFGDPDLAYFAVPNQVSQMQGTHEGTRYITAGGQINVLMHYLTGRQFAEVEGRKLFASLCANVTLQSSHPRPDFLPPRAPSALPVKPDAGEARFTCERGGRPLVGYLVTETDLIGQEPNYGWTVNQAWGFVASPALEPASMAMVVHAAKSLAFSPAWQQHENQLAAQNVGAAQQAFAAGEQARAATNARIALYDKQFDSADDLVTGTTHFVDPQTGQKYDLTTPNDHAWIGPNGKIMPTQSGNPPPGPGATWRALEPVPAQ